MEVVSSVASDVLAALAHNWPYLVLSVLAAAAAKVYVGADRLAGFLSRHTVVAVGAAVALATLTPFCSCGTMAIVLGGIAASAPWAPIVAFLVASPLTSPSELLLSAALFGWPFALLFLGGSIVLGLAAGAVAAALERTGWLSDQARMNPDRPLEPAVPAAIGEAPAPWGPGTAHRTELPQRPTGLRLGQLWGETQRTAKRLITLFVLFAAAGYAAIEIMPSDLVDRLLGGAGVGSVGFAALLGIPAYISTEASLPLVAGLAAGGMGAGAAMAFLVTGAGTSVGAITGLFVIARARVVGLVVGLLLAGAVTLGWLANLVL